jgi:hypothetical protein
MLVAGFMSPPHTTYVGYIKEEWTVLYFAVDSSVITVSSVHLTSVGPLHHWEEIEGLRSCVNNNRPASLPFTLRRVYGKFSGRPALRPHDPKATPTHGPHRLIDSATQRLVAVRGGPSRWHRFIPIRPSASGLKCRKKWKRNRVFLTTSDISLILISKRNAILVQCVVLYFWLTFFMLLLFLLIFCCHLFVTIFVIIFMLKFL